MSLRELTACAGVSGFENEVRAYLIRQCKALADEVRVDALGNVIAICHATKPHAKRVMVAAHMDEVGLIVTGVEDSGLIRFAPVGGIDPRVMVSKRVIVGERHVRGVIGAKAIHLTSAEERKTPLPVKNLYIDIGAADKEAALKLVEPGDPVIFDSRYVEFGDGLIKSRALDDRAGCGMLLSAMEHRYPVELAAVFTVQEEIGTRGAKAAAYRLDPDAALVLEGTTCADIAGVKDEQKVTRLGKGPVVGVRDSSAVHDPRLRAFVLETAAKYGIAVQNREGTFGGTDCGSIQRSRGGVPVAMMAVATRFIHSPVTVIARKDYEAGCALLAHVLQDMESFLNDKEGDCNE